MKTHRALAAAILLGSAGIAFADHANPWAGDDDTVLAKNHEANQSQSDDTPGEDEMRGVMVGNAVGKTGESAAGGGRKR